MGALFEEGPAGREPDPAVARPARRKGLSRLRDGIEPTESEWETREQALHGRPRPPARPQRGRQARPDRGRRNGTAAANGGPPRSTVGGRHRPAPHAGAARASRAHGASDPRPSGSASCALRRRATALRWSVGSPDPPEDCARWPRFARGDREGLVVGYPNHHHARRSPASGRTRVPTGVPSGRAARRPFANAGARRGSVEGVAPYHAVPRRTHLPRRAEGRRRTAAALGTWRAAAELTAAPPEDVAGELAHRAACGARARALALCAAGDGGEGTTPPAGRARREGTVASDWSTRAVERRRRRASRARRAAAPHDGTAMLTVGSCAPAGTQPGFLRKLFWDRRCREGSSARRSGRL